MSTFIQDGSSGSGRGWWGLDGVGSGQGQEAGACGYGEEPSGSENAEAVSFSRGALLHGVSK